jgi:glutathione S-transferase
MLKLFYSPASPFVRKVLVTAYETGQIDQIAKLASAAHPVNRDIEVVAWNPLGKVPTAIDGEERVLYDSRVICEYLDAQSTGVRAFPQDGPRRWAALVQQALGDGLIDAALLARYEANVRPAEFQWRPWREGQIAKIGAALDTIETVVPQLSGDVTIGSITIGCALAYLDFRFADYRWRNGRPQAATWFETFSARPSMVATYAHDVAPVR